MKKSKRLVFFGTDDFSAKSLQALIDDGWQVQAVVTKPDTKSGRGQKIEPPKVKIIAKNYDIQVLQPDKLNSFEDIIRKLGADIGVLVAYGKIIPQSIIDAFPLGILNIHPSELPKYRGPSPVEAAILSGDSETAISLMKLTSGMDEGPVYTQRKVALNGTEDRLALSQRMSELGAEMLVLNLPKIIDGSLLPQPQDNGAATYTKLLEKSDGITDWQEPAIDIERKIRAYLGFPKMKAEVFGQPVVITKARVVSDEDDGQLIMECKPGYLEILLLIAPSGRKMSGADFIRGYKN